jgi:antitoxin (DNA-binding transcriptional repressor) of toxin-antitoxin stability system
VGNHRWKLSQFNHLAIIGPEAAMVELDYREVIERFEEILEAVREGQTFRIFRDGRPIAIMDRHVDRLPQTTEPTAPVA